MPPTSGCRQRPQRPRPRRRRGLRCRRRRTGRPGREPPKRPKVSAAAASRKPATSRHEADGERASRAVLLARGEDVGGVGSRTSGGRRRAARRASVRAPPSQRPRRAAVPSEVEDEGEEDGDRDAADRRQLAAVAAAGGGPGVDRALDGARRAGFAGRARARLRAWTRVVPCRELDMRWCSTPGGRFPRRARDLRRASARPQTSTTTGMIIGRCRVSR